MGNGDIWHIRKTLLHQVTINCSCETCQLQSLYSEIALSLLQFSYVFELTMDEELYRMVKGILFENMGGGVSLRSAAFGGNIVFHLSIYI